MQCIFPTSESKWIDPKEFCSNEYSSDSCKGWL